jgi:hypothetical protein
MFEVKQLLSGLPPQTHPILAAHPSMNFHPPPTLAKHYHRYHGREQRSPRMIYPSGGQGQQSKGGGRGEEDARRGVRGKIYFTRYLETFTYNRVKFIDIINRISALTDS